MVKSLVTLLGLLAYSPLWATTQSINYSPNAPYFGDTALTDAATISLDASQGTGFFVTITANRTLANPINAKAGVTYALRVTQGAGGSKLLSYGTAYKFPSAIAPILSTAAAAVDIMQFYSDGTSFFYLGKQLDEQSIVLAPSSLVATGIAGPKMRLTWTNNASDQTGVDIYKFDGLDYSLLTTVGAAVATYDDTDVIAATQYSYKVQAKRGSYISAFSNVGTGTTP